MLKERIETLKEDQFQNEFQKNLNRFRSWQVEIGILRQMKPCGQVETSTASIYQISQRKCIKCRIKVVAILFPIHPFLLHPKNALFGNPILLFLPLVKICFWLISTETTWIELSHLTSALTALRNIQLRNGHSKQIHTHFS